MALYDITKDLADAGMTVEDAIAIIGKDDLVIGNGEVHVHGVRARRRLWREIDRREEVAAAKKAAATRVIYRRLSSGEWGIQGPGLVAGETVTVTKRSGETKTETVGSILTDEDGVQTATIAGRVSPAQRSCSHYERDNRGYCYSCGHYGRAYDVGPDMRDYLGIEL